MSKISRKQYADLFGPTTGDKIRLGDTDLYIEIEKDLRVIGDEIDLRRRQDPARRHGDGQPAHQEAGCLDLVITNVTVLDPKLGVVKADVGIKRRQDRRRRQGRQPSTMDGVTPGLDTGTCHRRHLGRAADPDRRRHRHARPLHLPATGVGGAEQRHHHVLRGRHRAHRWHQRRPRSHRPLAHAT